MVTMSQHITAMEIGFYVLFRGMKSFKKLGYFEKILINLFLTSDKRRAIKGN